MLLDEYQVIPWKVLNFLGSEINYGGRVTDDKDVTLIKSILARFMNENLLEDKHPLSGKKKKKRERNNKFFFIIYNL
jgi:dynein heavy chain, axonemal